MIAIVYSHPKEETEYRQHVEFLQTKGFLEGEIEALDLEDVQGIQGLKALRVHVKMEDGDAHGPTDEKLADVVQAMVHSALKE
jgi:hypothetical protein